jgi:hypothetical protein
MFAGIELKEMGEPNATKIGKTENGAATVTAKV